MIGALLGCFSYPARLGMSLSLVGNFPFQSSTYLLILRVRKSPKLQPIEEGFQACH